MAQDSDQSILLREILVAIDTSQHSLAALEAAALLAKLSEANIRGLFVQEELWNRISRLPSTQAINDLTGDILPLGEENLDEKIGILTRRLRRKLEFISRRNQVSHSWNTVQGIVEEKILEASKEADLITIGFRGQSLRRKKNLGSSALAVIQKSNKPVLILKQGLRLGVVTITVVYDASKESQKGLKMALKLAEKNDSLLSVLVADNNPDALDQRNKKLEKILEQTSVSVNIKLLKQTDTWSLLHSLTHQNSGLLVIPKNQPIIQNSLQTVLKYLNCPLLLIS